MSKGRFHYYTRNGTEYAMHRRSVRRDKHSNPSHEVVYLGKVIDKEKQIFWSKERGEFHYTIEEGFEQIKQNQNSIEKELLMVTLGDAWLLEKMLTTSGYDEVLRMSMPKESDTLISHIGYKLLGKHLTPDQAIDLLKIFHF
ncbi:MAG: hypothetical protein LBE38_00260 [Deltaproteobacteria bacterium]|nr:hypothetical protein [Deltaproteobacteria bacterium]